MLPLPQGEVSNLENSMTYTKAAKKLGPYGFENCSASQA